jgi:hypothetical protein
MIDCSTEMTDYYDDEVALPSTARTQMRDHRDANRKRLRNGLTKAEKPLPKNFHSQGSYAMKTMVQHDDNKYDIDDGVYFDKDQLVGDRGGEMTALAVRQMVRDAVDDGSFARAPEVRKHCVRVYYQAGYHVDLPIYRKVEEKNWSGDVTSHYELASSVWKRSDARDVTKWFQEQNTLLSPEADNDLMRRICRYLKKFAHSRPSWSAQVTTGFVITKLVSEKLKVVGTRDDDTILQTMKAIRDRLNWDLEVAHPVTPNDKLSKGTDDPKIAFFRDKLSDAIEWLKPLESSDCTKADALDAWDKVFNTNYFSDRDVSEEAEPTTKSASWIGPVVASAAILGTISAEAAKSRPVNKSGSNRYA